MHLQACNYELNEMSPNEMSLNSIGVFRTSGPLIQKVRSRTIF